MLTQQRYQFPNSWLYAENVDGEWSALNDILERKDSAIQAQGAQRPDEALAALASFEAKLNKVKEDRENMTKAKGALDITEPLTATGQAIKLDVAVEELSDLKGVWQSLIPLYNAVDELKEKTWLSVQPRKLRQSLDELLNQLKLLPSKYRSYESYDYAKQMLDKRHWKQLMKELHVTWTLSDLTLGQVWEANLLRYESVIKQVLSVREYWQSFEVDLVNYQNKTKLIRGWDDLFNKLKEHMNSLTAMKLSPYYKQFEEVNSVVEFFFVVRGNLALKIHW
ncbi:unnamed protein product [Gongylonema pulchrum]|uniref:Dynein heavy chain linker domain-containing protein n=1 Tax=Gongylonema pulchrum TaxID=637853 RepID=A0A3P7N4E9_9BILA|nr:unnamed protein product [Gongylonema pulchrum]